MFSIDIQGESSRLVCSKVTPFGGSLQLKGGTFLSQVHDTYSDHDLSKKISERENISRVVYKCPCFTMGTVSHQELCYVSWSQGQTAFKECICQSDV